MQSSGKPVKSVMVGGSSKLVAKDTSWGGKDTEHFVKRRVEKRGGGIKNKE